MKKKIESKFVAILDALEKLYMFIAKAKVTQMAKVIVFTVIMVFIINIGGIMYQAVKNPVILNDVVNKFVNSTNRIELENQAIREKVTPEIYQDLKDLNASIDADRVCVLEFHNGKENMSMMPFKYADMTYEEINNDRKVLRIANDFQNMNLTHYPFASYLAKDKMFAGKTKDMFDIDENFTSKVEDYNGD